MPWPTKKPSPLTTSAPDPVADKGREGRLDFAGVTCIQNHDARAEDTSRILHYPSFSLGLNDVGRIDEHCDRGG